MAYITIADIQNKIDANELIRLTDTAGSGSVDTTKIQEAITEAQAEVDAYCGRLYPVPFADPVPPMIVKVCKDIAIYNVYALKNAAEEDVEDRYKNARVFLRDVARGEVELGAGAPPEEDDGGPEALKTADSKTFSLGTMEGF